MSFTALIGRANAAALARFANCTVSVMLSGVALRSFPGIFDQETTVVSPFEGERVLGKPTVTVTPADCAGLTGAHTLRIAGYPGAEVPGGDYALDGKPRPDGAGFTALALAVKK